MKISMTPAAASFISDSNAAAITVASLVFSSCCSGPLPPEVKPGPPADTEGFDTYTADNVTIFYDSLLDPRPELVIDCKDYGSYRELFIRGWE